MADGDAPASAAAAGGGAAATAAPSEAPRRSSLLARLFFFRRRRGNQSSSAPAPQSKPSLSPPSDWNPKKIAAANPPARDIVLSAAVSEQGGGSGSKNGAIEHGGGAGSETVVRICRVGAAVRSLVLPDGTDIVLGSDETLPYLDGSLPYFGVVVGRVANRISEASFTLPGEGQEVSLPANDNGRHCLHGGVVGFDKREWSVGEEENGKETSSSRSSVLLSLLSKDGDQGFPGNVRAKVLYELLPGGKALRITFSATTDKPTAVAMTQHSYFNLDGGGIGSGSAQKSGEKGEKGGKEKGKEKQKHTAEPLSTILDHSLQIDASHYLPKNEDTGIPDGRKAPVEGTFLDFRKGKRIGEGSGNGGESGESGERAEGAEPGGAFADGRRGFDDFFAVDGFKGPGHVRRAAVLSSSSSNNSESNKPKRSLEIWTDAAGIQFYSAGFCGLPPSPLVKGKKGTLHGPYAGAALETHAFPNGVNATEGGEKEVGEWKRGMVLNPGEEYKHIVEWRFSW